MSKIDAYMILLNWRKKGDWEEFCNSEFIIALDIALTELSKLIV